MQTLEIRANVPVWEGQEASSQVLLTALWDSLDEAQITHLATATDFAQLAKATQLPGHLALMLPAFKEARPITQALVAMSEEGPAKAGALAVLLNNLDARTLEVVAGLCGLAGEGAFPVLDWLFPKKSLEPKS